MKSAKINLQNHNYISWNTLERPSVRDITRAPAGGISGSGTYMRKLINEQIHLMTYYFIKQYKITRYQEREQ